MPGSYSTDLRERVLVAVEAGEPVDAAAERFLVGRSSVYRWIAASREGRRAPKRLGGGPKPIIYGEIEMALRRLLEADNHLTLAECRDRLAEETGVRVAPWTIGRAAAAGLDVKETQPQRSRTGPRGRRAGACELADRSSCWDWRDRAGATGVHRRERRADQHGPPLWPQPARTTRAKMPFGHWKRLSVLGAISLDGIVATMSVDAATDSAVFVAYLDEVLLPRLRQNKPDAVLVMDNLQAHKTPEVRAVLDRSGFAYRYLPSYSPDLSPIEPAWAKVKSYLRRVAARTIEALEHALGLALDAITAQDAAGFFRHCGYLRPN